MQTYPQWQLATNERDESSHWMSGTGDPDYEDRRDVDIAPRKRKELVQWLTKPIPERRPFYEDTWREVCRARFFHSFFALRDLAQDGVWPASRWREALQAWAEEGIVLRSWRYAAPLVQTMPDAVFLEIDHAVTWWMEAASKAISRHVDILLNLCRQVLAFLWSPRLYQPLLTAFKSQFLDSANHYADLGEHRQQFATFLTYAALGPTEGYTVEEFRSAIGALPQEGLEESAQALSQALEGAADQREDYWKNRAQPFWQKIWPKSRNLATPRIAESLTHMVIASRGEFPATLAAVQDWLQPIEHPHYVVHLLQKSGLCSRYPADALSLLNAVITDQPWGPRELEQCLKQIVQAKPQLEKEPSFLKLREYDRRRRA